MPWRMTEEKDKIMKEKFCKWIQAVTFGLVCFNWCVCCCEPGSCCKE